MFGDIIAIYSGATKLVEYAYDAWGNCTIVSDTGNIGFGNPFRYRGYYWDSDLQLYYLMSRYYDPQTGRFINADSLEYLDPETIGGLNLYAYCGNNPINKFDPLGHYSLEGLLTQALFTFLGHFIFVTWAIGDLIFNQGEGAWSDMCNIGWDIFNEDAEKVTDANYVSFYKGVPVLTVDDMGGSMSLGWIFLDKDKGVDTLRHERGHSDQLMELGLVNYIVQIGIPSPLKNQNDSPWELSASMLGGDTRANNYSAEKKLEAMIYYKRAKIPLINLYNIIYFIFY